MKKLLLGLMLMASIAHADNEFKYTPNNAGGFIFFTYSYCVYRDTGQRVGTDSFYVYSTNSNGQRVQEGCYVYKNPFYVIDWNSGGRTTINANSTDTIN